MKPVLVAKFDEGGALAQLPDGTLMTFFIRTVDDVREVVARFSRDNGYSWSEQILFKVPTKPGQG